MSGVVEDWAKLALACPVTTTQGSRDAIAALEAASAQAEALLGRSLLEDGVDATTGELHPVVVVTDNGPCYRSVAFERYITARPELAHVRTRCRSPQTNGVIERSYESINDEHLYRHEIGDGLVLAREAGQPSTRWHRSWTPDRVILADAYQALLRHGPVPHPSSPLTIHRLRDPRTGDAYALVLPMVVVGYQVLGGVSVVRAADIIRHPWGPVPRTEAAAPRRLALNHRRMLRRAVLAVAVA